MKISINRVTYTEGTKDREHSKCNRTIYSKKSHNQASIILKEKQICGLK